MRVGDMVVYAAYAHEGKSFFLLNDAHLNWVQGKNVAYANGEMGGFKLPHRWVSLHAAWLYNQGKVPLPLETRKMDRGLFSKEEHEVFLSVLDDIRNRGGGKYGRFFHHTFGLNTTPSTIFNKFAADDQIVPLDLVCVDYLMLLASESRRVTNREILDEVIRHSKQNALSFRKGAGIPLLTAYQTNRASYERATQEGYYNLSCFAESSEAEKSADAAIWLLNLRQNPNEVKVGVMKNRDDELGEPFHVTRDFKHAQLLSLQSSRGRAAAGGPGAGLLDL
jgi:replicative DNA helicase